MAEEMFQLINGILCKHDDAVLGSPGASRWGSKSLELIGQGV